MKLISWYCFMSTGSLAIVLALSTFPRCDDWSGSILTVSEESQSQTPSSPGAAKSSATKKQEDRTTPVAPTPEGVPITPPSTGDYGFEATREESAASDTSTYTPNMIGDMGGGQNLRITLSQGDLQINTGVPSPRAGILGRQRISDNDSPIPTDRLFCDYSYFHDAALTLPSDASRFVPGFEKTLFDGRMSVEMRFPMGIMESSDIAADSSSFGTTGQFGDIQVIGKAILLQQDSWTLSTGLGISLPTAPDVNVGLTDGTSLVKIANRSTHLLPFFGLLAKPNDDWFAQAFLQIDFAASGDPVSANLTGAALTPVGNIYDETLIFADVSIGRWLYRDPAQHFSGLAAVVEAHYTGGINSPSTLHANNGITNFALGVSPVGYNVLDLTLGAHAVVGSTTITVGYVTPVTEDRGFEGELRFFVNRKF